MQPTVAIQKAYEEIELANAQHPDFYVEQGVLKAQTALESARLGPETADFGHLHTVVRDEALAPAARVVVREATGLAEQTAAWIRVQQQISDLLRQLSDITAAGLKAADQ